MNELSLKAFQHAIRQTHDAEAKIADRVKVNERFGDQSVWMGEVLVFDLEGHPTASRCYAWEVDGRVTAVLHEPPVDSPLAAVRAAVIEGSRKND